jgi:hypothetical protein
VVGTDNGVGTWPHNKTNDAKKNTKNENEERMRWTYVLRDKRGVYVVRKFVS